MSNIASLTSAQLKRAAVIKDKIDTLSRQLNSLLGGSAPAVAKGAGKVKRGGMSAAGRARIAAAQRARWAKIKSAKKG